MKISQQPRRTAINHWCVSSLVFALVFQLVTSPSHADDSVKGEESQAAVTIASKLKNTGKSDSLKKLDPKQTNESDNAIKSPGDSNAPNKSDADNPPRSLPALIEFAEHAMQRFDDEIDSYTCVLLKREMVEDTLEPTQVIRLKIREQRRKDKKLEIPRSIYAKFLKPRDVAGREILFVENRLNGDFLVRRGGLRLPNLTLELKPDSRIAQAETKHSVLDIGIRPMLQKLLDRMEKQLDGSKYSLKFFEDAKVDGRLCEHIEVRQLERHDELDYQVAKVYIDRELQLPVYFSSYAWSDKADGKPTLQEQYAITKLNLQPNLEAIDFDRTNPDYLFKNK